MKKDINKKKVLVLANIIVFVGIIFLLLFANYVLVLPVPQIQGLLIGSAFVVFATLFIDILYISSGD